jgi:hypothetical protein
VHKTPGEGIKLDMDLAWQGVCDIELDGSRVPKIVSRRRDSCWIKV